MTEMQIAGIMNSQRTFSCPGARVEIKAPTMPMIQTDDVVSDCFQKTKFDVTHLGKS